ncbi:hypothetical protein [uncultured Eubacterium sp.]|uniref:hypothetical protein n=1 Tax=uncultured Eubacterium sp. TaxID=165185 RepID=UPI002639A702|nr:hypothetical protein [uncultured Eubacterium sp.]
MGKDNLIVDESELDSFCENLYNHARNLDSKTSKYINILNKIHNDSIMFGETAKTLTAFIDFSKSLNTQFNVVAQQCRIKTKNFKSQIDADDKFLY